MGIPSHLSMSLSPGVPLAVVPRGAAGRAIYNYGTGMRKSQDMFGASVFVKDCSRDKANTAGQPENLA